ncbi:MAG: hypothetical protein GC145_14570 [Caulobacter sp.]|nr:hypothetical protein [Caulobacter sp.]
MRLLISALALATLAACSEPAPPAATVAQSPAPAIETRPTYGTTAGDAVSQWGKLDALQAVGPAEGVEASLGDCQAHTGKSLSVRVCSIDGRVSNMLVASRGAVSPSQLDGILQATVAIVAPDAEAADLVRIRREAREGLAKGGTMLCPTTRCFNIAPLGDGVTVNADAST